jgi:hypothetical protein
MIGSAARPSPGELEGWIVTIHPSIRLAAPKMDDTTRGCVESAAPFGFGPAWARREFGRGRTCCLAGIRPVFDRYLRLRRITRPAARRPATLLLQGSARNHTLAGQGDSPRFSGPSGPRFAPSSSGVRVGTTKHPKIIAGLEAPSLKVARANLINQ